MGRTEVHRTDIKEVEDMYIWGRGPGLASGEEVRWRACANRRLDGRVAAGWLFVTTERIIFRASRLDRLFGREDWEASVAQYVDSGVSDRTLGDSPFGGGFRRRLVLNMKGGRSELFVVWSA